jgi:hypothetical protein
LNPVLPVGIQYHSALIDISNGAIPFESHLFVTGLNPFAWAEYNEMPVFEPNEFFFKNH